jgi:hypothetical protein
MLHVNVPPRYALAAIALALGVSVVAGRESRPAPPPAAAPAAPREADAPPALALERLERPGLGEARANLFTTPPARAAPPPSPPPVVAAPSVPPPLPYRFLGRYVEGGRSAVYLARGDEPFLAAPGALLGADYRVEEVSSEAVMLTYLPLGTRPRLPSPPQH